MTSRPSRKKQRASPASEDRLAASADRVEHTAAPSPSPPASSSPIDRLFAYLAEEFDDSAAAATSAASSSLVPLSLPPSASLGCLVILFSLLLRYLVAGWSYSGAHSPPQFGDFEAQRHWMEITLHTPLSEWYHNTTHNDLNYWGLDYPPLTAYVSWIFGWIASTAGMGEMVALHSSRGFESAESKLFMRLSVLLCDLVVFFPAALLALKALNREAKESRYWVLALLTLVSPGLILIDHGHFQYNSFALGLVLWAVYYIHVGNELPAAIAFVASMCFKQMTLYFSPAFFFYLLARTRMGKGGRVVSLATTLGRLVILGSVVIGSFTLFFAPFLTSVEQITQVLHRLFPFARGLYEDKVANVWCASSILIKWHLWFAREKMVKAALVATVLAFSPSVTHVYLRPSRRSFVYCLACCAFAFYLFSFQVHEKTILLPMLPVALMVGQHPLLVSWMSLIANFSMYPLLERDGHAITYASLQIFFGLLSLSFARAQLDAGASYSSSTDDHPSLPRWLSPLVGYRLVQASVLGTVVLHAVWLLAPPSTRYPDLLTMLFVVYSAAHFVVFHAILNWLQWQIPQANTEDQLFVQTRQWKRE